MLLGLTNETVQWDRPGGLQEGPGVYFTNRTNDAARYGPNLISCAVVKGFRYLRNVKPTLRILEDFVRTNADPPDIDRFLRDHEAETLEAALKPYTYADTRLDALVQLYGGGGVIQCPYRWAAAMRRISDGVIINRTEGVRHLVVWNLKAVRLKEIE